MNLDDFSYEENGRRYINPQVALDEENAFIQNLRDTQTQDNAKIYQDTHNLGTDVTSNLGGLNGGETYFNARYQTPQTNYSVANLRSAAQAKALTDALNNEVEKAKKRYQDAYYSARNKANNPSSNGGDTASDPEHNNPSDPAQDNPNGTDTVESRTSGVNPEANAAIGAANQYNAATGGGQLPSGAQRKIAYLVAPNGAKYMLKSDKTLYGANWTAPSIGKDGATAIDYENKGSFNSHIQNYVNKGYKVQLSNGKDITGSYGIYFTWF